MEFMENSGKLSENASGGKRSYFEKSEKAKTQSRLEDILRTF